MRTESLPYQRVGNIVEDFKKVKGKKLIMSVLSGENILLMVIAFLLGRASLVAGLMPFGMAIYASTLGININRVMVAAVIILGMITGGAVEQVYIFAAAMLIFNAINITFKNGKSKSNVRYAVASLVSVLIPELVSTYFQGFLLYDFLKAVLHGFIAFTLVFIFRRAVPALSRTRKRHIFSSEEIISVAIMSGLALSGFGTAEVFGFCLKNIMCILVILMLSYKCGPGVGAAVGVTIGLVVSMSSAASPLVIGSYAFCGLLSGVFKSLGKVGSALGFVMGNAVLTIYMNGSTEVLIYLKEIVLSIGVFMLLPQKFIDIMVGAFGRNSDTCVDKRSYSSRIKEITVDRLNKFSRTFKELSKTFEEISETRMVTEKQDISGLLDRVADRVCKDCSLCLHCWDRNFYSTYQVMFKIVEELEEKGRIEEKDIPDYFTQKCERIYEFAQAVNNVYEIFKVDMVWRGKVGESRGLVSQQLNGLSKVISNLASEIDMDVHFKSDFEDMILAELNKEGVRASEVIVFENKWGKYEVNVFHKGCGGKRSCINTIQNVVSETLGRKMAKEGTECCQETGNKSCSLKLVEEEVYRVNTGVAKISKYGGIISGDTYTFMNSGEGKYVIALSDGMGSGQKAAVQSRAAISMLEQFMESGFDKDTAIKLVNSILVLKSSDDSFATIDLSVVDLYDGEVEFLKTGAAPTFLKRDSRVEVIKTVSLPAGILSNIETELVSKNLNSGDFIIMVTDGVMDSFKKDDGGENALREFIQGIGSINSQEIADSIMNKAYENFDGKPMDDMMVLVAKIWKRVG